jgi:GDPmannose 4,6-dehydratase
MLQNETPSDYVIATGSTYSVRDFVERAIFSAGLKGKLEDYVEFDSEMIRPSEVDLLVGDAKKAKEFLNWAPTKSFDELVELMVENDLKLEGLK